jgi:hypothetical protein
MIYHFPDLRTTAFIVGLAMVLLHGFALLKPDAVGGWLKVFPRSRKLGTVLLTIAAGWAMYLLATIDLGEFTKYRTPLLILIPVSYVLSWKFVDEFLAVRALGMLLLLLAEPVLESAFMQPERWRLLLVVLAYAWVVKGIFLVGMPYLMRDQIQWVTRSRARWNVMFGAGLAYGIALLICCSAIRFR